MCFLFDYFHFSLFFFSFYIKVRIHKSFSYELQDSFFSFQKQWNNKTLNFFQIKIVIIFADIFFFSFKLLFSMFQNKINFSIPFSHLFFYSFNFLFFHNKYYFHIILILLKYYCNKWYHKIRTLSLII